MSEFQAGGTDVQERLRRGITRGPVTGLGPADLSDRIDWKDGRASLGALVRLATVAHDARIASAYPGLAAAAGGLATPQIRAVATVGGALLQRTRCWYFRDPGVSCFKKGGTDCPARRGDHTYGVCVDLGPCIWPHPSTLGAALLAYEAEVTCEPGGVMSAAALFGDGSDPTRDHCLASGQVLTGVGLGPPVAGERAGYHRVIGRQLAEWPLVEAVVRLVVDGGRITFARVALGGVATVPLRMTDLERALVGCEATPSEVARLAADILRMPATLAATRYKVDLIPVAIGDAAALALAPATASSSIQAAWALPWTSR
jgi:xanthine dehydrogenase YagS FAD-binding subunit